MTKQRFKAQIEKKKKKLRSEDVLLRGVVEIRVRALAQPRARTHLSSGCLQRAHFSGGGGVSQKSSHIYLTSLPQRLESKHAPEAVEEEK